MSERGQADGNRETEARPEEVPYPSGVRPGQKVKLILRLFQA
jgi:hypothetical protein